MMSTPSAARRDARNNFCPGYDPSGYRYKDSYYRKLFDEEWKELQKAHDKLCHKEEEFPEQELTLGERVAALEEQVKQLREAGGL